MPASLWIATALGCSLAAEHDFHNTKCKSAASKHPTVNNAWCMALCDQDGIPSSNPEWQTHCLIADANITADRKLTSNCFNTWVYGHVTPDVVGSMSPVELCDTPALCQALCQSTPNCAGWLWTIQTRECRLKSVRMIAMAQVIDVSNMAESDARFCPIDSAELAKSNKRTFLRCAGALRCIWDSHEYVSGPPYCTSLFDHCSPVPSSLVAKEAGSSLAAPKSFAHVFAKETPSCGWLDGNWTMASPFNDIRLTVDHSLFPLVKFRFKVAHEWLAMELRALSADCLAAQALTSRTSAGATHKSLVALRETLLNLRSYHYDAAKRNFSAVTTDAQRLEVLELLLSTMSNRACL